ncbi:hypothetical protein [Mycobacterium sp.]|uniref:hypothetical protein n=1 Tax=Mycobacterium sp. TaxID=1785 RepID=UPI003F970856
MESGTRPTSIAEVHLLAGTLGVKVTDLFVTDPGVEIDLRMAKLVAESDRLLAELAKTREREAKLLEERKAVIEQLQELGATIRKQNREALEAAEELLSRPLPLVRPARTPTGEV